MKNYCSYLDVLFKRQLNRIIRIMKLTGLLSFAVLLNVEASVYSQDARSIPASDEKIVLNLQQIVVKGTITDASTGEPLPGASILVAGTTRGVISDTEGKYSIEASP